MEFKDFAEMRKRICEHYSRCSSGCPLYPREFPKYPEMFPDKSYHYVTCEDWCLNHYELAEEIVDRWTKDNPILTNAMKFKEVFGVNILYSWENPEYFYIKEMLDRKEDMRKWLRSEYIAPEEKQND